MFDEVITGKYVFKITYTDGIESEFQHEGSYASVKKDICGLDKRKKFLKFWYLN